MRRSEMLLLQDGGCLRAIQVRKHATIENSVCFHLMRSDGTLEDFSVNKCLTTLYPAWAQSRAAKVRPPSSEVLRELLLAHDCVSCCVCSSSSQTEKEHITSSTSMFRAALLQCLPF